MPRARPQRPIQTHPRPAPAAYPPRPGRPMRVTRWRQVASGLLGLLTIAWITSLPLAPFPPLPEQPAGPLDAPLLRVAPSAPSWRDTLVIDLIVNAPGVQQQRGHLRWIQGRQRASMAVTFLANGHPQRLVLPIGTHPAWRGAVSSPRLGLLHPDGLTVTITQVQYGQRSPWALDALLLRGLAPLLPAFPPWSHAVLLVAALLSGLLALLWPGSHWRQRLAVGGVLLGVGSGGATILAQVRLLLVLIADYGTLDTATAIARSPQYDEHPQAMIALARHADDLPNGPILLLDQNSSSDLLHRARYLLYPRRVDQHSPQTNPTDLPRMIAAEYVGVMERTPREQPPVPGWERIGSPTDPIALWRAPGIPAASLRPPVTGPVTLPLLAGLGLVGLVGWSLAGLVSGRGGLRLLNAWPLGVSLLAGWMWILAVSGITWSWSNIGLPLLLGAGLLCWVEWQRAGAPALRIRWPRLTWHWEHVGGLLIGLLMAAVMVQALLLPFTDRDTWRMWGLKGQAFYLDGDLAPVLRMYHQENVHHPAYPPAQPLVQAWLYLTMGGLDERLVKVIFPLWYLICVVAVGWIARQWTTRRAALGWMLLLATTPLMLDHATLANADLPLAVPLLLGGYTLSCWITEGRPMWLVGSVLLLASAAGIKLDGTYLGAGMLLAAVLVRGMTVRGRRCRRQTIGHGVLALCAFVALLLPWYAYTQALDLRSDIPGTAQLIQAGGELLWEGFRVIGAELLLSYNNSSLGLLGGGYGVLWLLCGAALLVGWQQIRQDAVLQFVLLVLLGGFLFYLGIYTLRPYYSIERYLLHLAPLAVVAAARATRPLAPLPRPHPPDGPAPAHGQTPSGRRTARRTARGRAVG